MSLASKHWDFCFSNGILRCELIGSLSKVKDIKSIWNPSFSDSGFCSHFPKSVPQATALKEAMGRVLSMFDPLHLPPIPCEHLPRMLHH